MKIIVYLGGLAATLIVAHAAGAAQADDTTIAITGQSAGATPFISQLSLEASTTDSIKSVQFTITPKMGSVTRPLSATYSKAYLTEHGYLNASTGEIFVYVYGLYAGYSNSVTLTYYFDDGSSSQDTTTITTDSFSHPCDLDSPTVLQARTDDTTLSYDYMLVKGGCSGGFEPVILDTDGALRWVSPTGFSILPSTFFDNAVYQADGTSLYRVELDGTITFLKDYTDFGDPDSQGTFLHHNIDRGKVGMILDLDTTEYIEAVNIEVDGAGNVLKMWNLGDIIKNAMIAGGDDPSQFVYEAPTDWFHNNAVTYNRADDSVLVSSRENFIICLDYETGDIKWILGDPNKHWHEFPSLAKYALDVPAGSLAPIGEHALSIAHDQNLLLLDNGFNSIFQQPPGITRTYASPRKYEINVAENTATEIYNYEMGQSILSPICSSIYEDAPNNYVIDYAFVGGFAAENPSAQLLGLNGAGEKVFYYQYPTNFCDTAYNTIPLHLERTGFPTVTARALNLSTRGNVGSGDDSLIGGFIVTGTESQKVVLRGIGPSLVNFGISGAVADPILTLYDADGKVVARNDDWQNAVGAAEIEAEGLAPSDPAEAATLQTLAPGAYTFVVSGKDSASPGIGLVEAYDLSPLADSRLSNLSTRGTVGTDAAQLISGFIVGEVDSNTVLIRGLGPSLSSAGLTSVLDDPTLTVYDSNGAIVAMNDNWQDGSTAADIEFNDLAPTDSAEAATIVHLPAGAYTTILSGVGGTTGTGLLEIYDL
ncbi:MAG: aryl-sulfate sulfotransferase [Chthoniobacterales bacterium]